MRRRRTISTEFRRFGHEHGLRIFLQPGGLDSISLLYPEGEREPLYYTLPEFDVRIEFEPIDFVQVNAEINRTMISRALELLAPEQQDRVLDLFCGIGNFSLPLARRCGEVLGVEGEAMLVRRAADNATANAITNAEFRQADLAAIDGTENWLQGPWDRLLLDPARSGACW
jgi:23S rRNA (uracil1939-C5)-methyltransferase